MNLELIINNEKWKVVVEEVKDGKSYWSVNTYKKVLTVHNYDVEKAKYQCWIQYKK